MCPGRTRSAGAVAGSIADFDRPRPVEGGNARGHSLLGVNGDGEGGFEPGGILADHERQLELGQPLRGQREADQPAPVAAHEIDAFGRGFFGGDHQVAFIFAVLVVDDNDQAAGADLLERLLDGDDPGWIIHDDSF